MGSTVCRAVAGSPACELVVAVDPNAAGRSLAEVAGLEESPLEVQPAIEALADAGAEVAVDFTHASAAVANMAWCAGAGVHAVCGTTGIGPDDLGRLRDLFAPADAPNCVLVPNFAVTAVLMMRFAELAAPFLDGVEIVELHHDAKRDAPSGTALETARRIAEARQASGAGPFAADPTAEEVAPGAAGPSARAGSVSTRCGSRGSWRTRRCCSARSASRSRSARTPTSAARSCRACSWP